MLRMLLGELVYDLYREDGILYLPAVYGEDADCKGRFLRCRLDWDKNDVGKDITDLEDLCFAVSDIAKYYATGAEYGSRPCLGEDETCEFEYDIWKHYIDGWSEDGKSRAQLEAEAKERIGDSPAAYLLVRLVNELCRCSIDPDGSEDFKKLLRTEERLIQTFILHRHAVSAEEISFMCEPDSGEGFFPSSSELADTDLPCIYELLEKHQFLMKDPKTGYFMLAAEILNDPQMSYRLIREGFDSAKAVMDDLISSLPGIQSELVKKRYGLGDGSRRSLAELGREHDLSESAVKVLAEYALIALSYPPHSDMLRELLTCSKQ